MRDLDTVVVVGASLAGVRSVQALRREGFAGRLVLVGAESHWPPYDRPPLSKQVLTGEWEPDQARLRGLADPFDAELVLGRRAESLDLEAGAVVLDDGTAVPFDGLVVATGASPRSLPGTSPSMAGVHVLRTIDDALVLRRDLSPGRRVAVIGAGFIGSEVASSCRALGLEVTLVEALDLPLQRILGPGMGEVAAELHRSHGVELRLAVGVRKIVGDERAEGIVLSDGSSFETDVVVVGIGVTPTTAWLERSGLLVDDGLVCDEACVAVGSDARVVAAGDVARWHNPLFGVSMRVEHWTNANEQAAHAARSLVHGASVAGGFAPVPYFWSDQHGTKFQFVGTSAATDDVVVVEGSIDEGKFVAGYGRDGVAVGALCVNWPARMNAWRKAIASRSPFPG